MTKLSEQQTIDRVNELRKKHNAVILAHNYQVPVIQDIADFVGDSLELSYKARDFDSNLIIFCGVHFMAETAAIICPEKKILIPDLGAGCSLAATINAKELKKWKQQHPDAAVVSYVNTTAEVKALTDICCTSSNAVKVVESIPKNKKILFLPDMFLAMYVKRITKRDNIEVWPGECHVHAGIKPQHIHEKLKQHPKADFLIHPECGCSTYCMVYFADKDIPQTTTKILSTSGMVKHAKESKKKDFVVSTETGILYPLKKKNPDKNFYPVKDDAICEYMKMITLDKVLNSFENMVYDVTVPYHIAKPAKRAIERMLEIS
ncbi:quinolinate synthase NadA [Patescibacteria group bacterium AH-259-L07]|nr:quinolinate synthase NadA [Patescibacteria group bacterium AH-259-L07]